MRSKDIDEVKGYRFSGGISVVLLRCVMLDAFRGDAMRFLFGSGV